MVVERPDSQDVGSCDVAVGPLRLEVVFDVFLEDRALALGSLGSHGSASGNTGVQRQLHLPSSQPATLTCFGAFAVRSLGCMAWPDAGLRDVAGHKDCLAT